MELEEAKLNDRLGKVVTQITKKTIVKLGFLLAIVLIVSCYGAADPFPDDANVELGIKTVASFDPIKFQLPESITMDSYGNIYLSMSPLREVWKLNPDGSFKEVVASFAIEDGLLGISGLKFDRQGNLYVAVSSALPDMNGVWKIRSNGKKERIPGMDNIGVANDLAVLPNGTLYITDAMLGAVWRYNPGEEAEMWKQDEALEGTGAFGVGFPIGANGIVVTQDRKSPSGQKQIGGVIVANSEKGQLVYIPILPNKSAGEPTIMIADPEVLFGLDGITMDEQGSIYGAVNFANKIVRIRGNGSKISELATGTPLDFPTSLTFGSGRDRHTLFTTNFGAIHFLSDPPMPGDASPAVISLSFKHK